MSQKKNPLRLLKKRFSDVRGFFWGRDVGDGLDGGAEIPGPWTYPLFRCLFQENYSWAGQVVGQRDGEIPYLWTPQMCARQLGVSTTNYLSNWCPVSPAGHPLRPIKAVIYNTATDAAGTIFEDLVALAAANLKDALRAKGVWVGRGYQVQPHAFISGAGGDLAMPDGASCGISGWAPLLSPFHGRYGAFWVDDPFTSNTDIRVQERNGIEYKAGEILYVQPQELTGFDWPGFTLAPDTFEAALIPATLQTQADYLNDAATRHERVGFHGVYVGHDSFPDVAPGPLQWSYTKSTALPALAALATNFSFDAIDAPNYFSGRGAAIDAIRAKIVSFFNLTV